MYPLSHSVADGKLKEIGSDKPFNFFYSPNDESLNQRRYEALGDVSIMKLIGESIDLCNFLS